MSNRKLADAARIGPVPAGWRARRDAWLLERADERLSAAGAGRLRVVLPSGVGALIGSGSRAEASVRLANYSILRAALMRGSLGFAEAYIDGSLETDDLAAVFAYFIRHEAALRRAGRGLFSVRLPDRIAHRRRDNTRRGSRRNIAAHYDLGNDFYSLWLDDGMTYSSGIYRNDASTLEQAQDEKYRVVLDALEMRPGVRALEVGSGWGGMAERMARAGANVTAITVSNEQLAYARRRIARAGLDRDAEIRFQDYRDTQGTFDRLVSVEMIEAVGEAHWPAYFQMLSDRLAPGGVGVIQAITIDEPWFADYRAGPDFIQRYIFPGGMLPTVSLMAAHAARVGLAFETVERFGLGYQRTLADWRVRFEAAWPQIAAKGFDDRFRRMWLYYMHYCEAGFGAGFTDVGIYRVRKKSA